MISDNKMSKCINWEIPDKLWKKPGFIPEKK